MTRRARTHRRGRGFALCGVAVLLTLVGAARSASAQPDELETLRQAIAESRDRLERYERDHRGLLETLEALDQSAEAMAGDLRRLRREAEAAEASAARAREDVEHSEAQLEATRQAMRRRALALYQSGEHGAMQVLFSSTSVREIVDRVRALQLLLDHDHRLIERFRVERLALDAARIDAEFAAERRRVALAGVEERRVALRAERRAKSGVLEGIRGDRARERSALAELERAARALEETLDRLDRSATPAPQIGRVPFAELEGSLPRPVEAPVARPFGRRVDDEFHTQLFHKGVDFEASLGTPVVAVAAGRVRFAGWFRGYGRLVILDHGDRFFTVSGHLDDIAVAVGDDVRAAQAIGTVGESGSLVGPRLYFEVRQGDEALDPAAWFEP